MGYGGSWTGHYTTKSLFAFLLNFIEVHVHWGSKIIFPKLFLTINYKCRIDQLHYTMQLISINYARLYHLSCRRRWIAPNHFLSLPILLLQYYLVPAHYPLLSLYLPFYLLPELLPFTTASFKPSCQVTLPTCHTSAILVSYFRFLFLLVLPSLV